MASSSIVSASSRKIRINWAHECITGALLSAAFTMMASNAGTRGVEAGSISDHLHNIIIIGGVSMGIVCGLAAAVLIFFQTLEMLVGLAANFTTQDWKQPSPFGQFHAVKFIKIFLP